jgi:hypothetical protein
MFIANNLSKAGWSWGCVSAIASSRRTVWISDAHRGDGKRFVVRADEKLTAFLELETAIAGFRLSVAALTKRADGLDPAHKIKLDKLSRIA